MADETPTTTHAQRMLAKIEAALEGTSDPSVRRQVINGKEIERYSPLELVKLHAIYQAKVDQETAAAANTGTTATFGTPVTFFGRCLG